MVSALDLPPVAPVDPYCGPPPLPETVWSSWNPDPILLVALFAGGILVLTWTQDRRGRIYLCGGFALLLLAFVSPLCALSAALFSARVLHHLVIVTLAAPLVALAWPPSARSGGTGSLAMPVLVHAILLWLWHAPAAYAWALSGVLAYWVMEISLLFSAIWLWRCILTSGARPVAALAALLATLLQMGFLGAVLTFAQRPLFAAHFLTTAPFSLSSLEDQQLAGLLMWAPGALPYVAAALWRLAGLLERAGGARVS